MNKVVKGKAEEVPANIASKQSQESDPEQELESNVSDDDHVSNRIPDSNVKITGQFNPKLPEATGVPPNIKNPVTKFVQIQNPTSPGGRSSSPKANSSPKNVPGGKFASKDGNAKENKPIKFQFNEKETEINEPDASKKSPNLRTSKDVVVEPIQLSKSGKQKTGEQNAKYTPQRTVSLSGKDKFTVSSDKKDKADDDSELPKKGHQDRLNPLQTAASPSKTQNVELQLSPYAAKEIENRKNTAQRELQEALAERLLKQGEILNEHSKALIEAYLQKEFEECTFNPMINAYGKNFDKKRSTGQFLDDQKKFLDLIEMKKQKIKSKIESEQKLIEGTYTPELCKKSLKILEKKKKTTPSIDEDVHSRLYKVNKNAQQKQMQDIAQNEEALEDSNTSSQFIGQLSRSSPKDTQGEGKVTFKPTIHKKSKGMKRNIHIDTILYNDAMRRVKKSIAHAKKPKEVNRPANNMSEESRKALASRFIREFEIVLAEILEGDKESKLDYIQLNEFLKKLSFLKDADKVDLPQFTPERILLYDMWYTMFADKFKGVHRRNLLVFLLAVMGLNYQITKIQKSETGESQNINAEENEEKKNSKISLDKDGPSEDKNNLSGGPPADAGILPRERRIIGNFDEDENWESTEEDVDKIHKIYNLWFVNRLGSKDNLGNILTTKRFEEPSYHPVINENSKNIAHLYREKILEGTSELIKENKIQAPKDGKLTHADLLVLSKKVVREKVEKFKASQEGNELRFCTFKPMTNDYSQSTKLQRKGSEIDENDENETKARSGGKERAFELYALRKPHIDKKNRDPYDIEYEKNCDQCTFQPDLRLTQEKKMDPGSPIMAKNIEKTIQRLRQANDAREQKNLWNQRGYYPQANETGLVFGVKKGTKHKLVEPLKPSPRLDYKKVLGASPIEMFSLRAYSTKSGGYLSGPSTDSTKGGKGQQVAQYNGEDDNGDEEEDYQYQEDPHAQDDNEEYEQPADDDNEHQPEDHENPDDVNHEEPGGERVPLLFVDVNLGAGKSERIIVFEGDKSEILAKQFADEHGLDDQMAGKLKELLDSQIAGLLTRIDEELNSLQSETDKNEHGGMGVYRHEDQINEEDDQD